MTPISLIIHARQQPEHLDLCLASLYRQTHGDFEVLVVDAETGDANNVVIEHHARHLRQPIRHIDAPGVFTDLLAKPIVQGLAQAGC